MDPTEDSNDVGDGEDGGVFPIPKILFVDLPIADVTANTKILHLGKPGHTDDLQQEMVIPVQGGGMHPLPNDNTDPPPPPAPQPGTSGATTPVTTVDAVTPINPATIPGLVQKQQGTHQKEGRIFTRPLKQPKKGTNTKNKNVNPQPMAQAEPQDDTLKGRMSLLEKITQLMQEMEVWGHYVGLKAGRIPVGRKRDKVLVRVEELLNDATYDDDEPDD